MKSRLKEEPRQKLLPKRVCTGLESFIKLEIRDKRVVSPWESSGPARLSVGMTLSNGEMLAGGLSCRRID